MEEQMKAEVFAALLEAVGQANAIERHQLAPARVEQVGKRKDTGALDVVEIRESLQLSQVQFAKAIGTSARTIQNWEQGHRRPTGPARMLLKIARDDPAAVLRASAGAVQIRPSATKGPTTVKRAKRAGPANRKP
jgi:putative transcriptional regulator